MTRTCFEFEPSAPPLATVCTVTFESEEQGERPVRPDAEADARLFSVLADELRRIASGLARSSDTLQPTALVNEAYIKLVKNGDEAWNDEHHFLRSVAVTMRSILLDHKRSRAAQKRGGDARHLPLDETLAAFERDCGGDIEAVHQALTELDRDDAVVAEYVTLRFFAGRTNSEASAALGISERTGTRYWKFARAWLHERLSK